MIRLAVEADLPALLPVYDEARRFMRRTGNMQQWINGFPQPEFLLQRIRLGCLYVMEDKAGVYGAFALVPGEDPTYAYIDGAWLSDTPYATIHQLASNGTHVGVFAECLRFCRERYDHLRVDTHEDNRVMQHVTEKHGFSRCGIIYLENGDPRVAYEWVK